MNDNNSNNKQSTDSSKTARNRRRRRRRAKAKKQAKSDQNKSNQNKSNENKSTPHSQQQKKRGRALNTTKPTKTKKPQQQQQEEQRAARSKLIQEKQVDIRSELNKKEKMLHIMAAADAISNGENPPKPPKSMQNNTIYSAKSISSKQAFAAEKRIQQKQIKKAKNAKERKKRTRDLLFGDGLKDKDDQKIGDDDDDDDKTQRIRNKSNNKKSAVLYKSDSKAAEAALTRFGQQKNNKVNTSKDRKQRTMQLIHGDLLRDDDEIKVAPPRQSTYNDDMDEDIADIHQSILNLINCNSHQSMPGTAKLLRKIITNLLSADTIYDEEKYGKLRLSNKKIKTAFVEIQYGLETLQSLGFNKKKIYNDTEHKMDEYMVFDFGNTNYNALIHAMDLLNEYYPE